MPISPMPTSGPCHRTVRPGPRDASDKDPGSQINIVLHWFDELKQEQRK
jgi:hypothetical protein